MSTLRRVVAALALCLAGTFGALGQQTLAKKPYNPGWKYTSYKQHIDVNDDGSRTETVDYSLTVLADSTLKSSSQQTISYHEGGEVLEDVVAYTKKADGRRIDVPDGNVQVTSHNGINGTAPAFSDLKDRHIVFPDVAVGDSIVLAYTLRGHKPTFKNHYSLLSRYSEAEAYDHAELVVTAPKRLGLRQATYHLEAPKVEDVDGGRVRWTWTYRNTQPTDYSAESDIYQRAWSYKDFPSIEISNFRDYAEIAAAYEEEAAKRAGVDERIRALAEDITKDSKNKREEAEKIYRWAVKNITFAGNCLSGGDVVPRPTATILDMKMGDCKDHATLVQALLSARGIKSSQALINTAAWYELPEIPCWQAFNHVIDYLPDYDAYLDATSTTSPFGVLPPQEHGKPTIHTTAYRGIERTPMRGSSDNQSDAVTDMTVRPDGGVDVRASYKFTGEMANGLSQSFAEWKRSPDFDGGQRTIQRWLERSGHKGSGGYDGIANTDSATDAFSYEMHYHVEDYLDTSNPYGVTLAAQFPAPNSIADTAAAAAVDQYPHEFLCHGDVRREKLTITFPPNVKLLAVPKNVHEQTALVRFDANYERHGNTLMVTRTITDTTPGPVCAPDIVAQYAKIGAAVKKDAKAQAVYQPR